MDSRFTRDGYTDWKNLGTACMKHDRSNTHGIALQKLEAFKSSHGPHSRGTVLNQMHGDAKFFDRHREQVKLSLDVVMLCAKMGVPLRGHDETAESLNRGNFLTLFDHTIQYDRQYDTQMPRNATMTSHHIQDELLQAAASVLLGKIKDELKGQYFAILADEYKDISKRELVAVCIRFMAGGLIKERAVGFLDTADMTARGITEKILEIIAPLALDPKLCVGLCCDGASVMSGYKGGVQALLKETFPSAVYVHCNSHRLNLVLCTAAKASLEISSFFDNVNQIYSFFTGAQRHARFMEIQKEMGRVKCLELQRACDTRWSSKSGSVHKILSLLDEILEALCEYAETRSTSTVEAENLLNQIQTKKFLFLLVSFCKFFDNSDFATKELQSASLCVTTCISLIEQLKAKFVTFRDDSNGDFAEVLRLTDELMEKHDVTKWDVTQSRKRKLPAKFDDSTVTTSLGKTSRINCNDDLRALWNCVLDRQITELNCRFKEDTYGIMTASASLLPGSASFGMKELLEGPCKLYGIDIRDTEYAWFTENITRRMDEENLKLPTIMEVLDNCSAASFPNVHRLLRAIITLPLTSCSVERLFSATNRVQTRLRASMLTHRLNNLTLLTFERDLIGKKDYDDIISVFNSKPRRLRLV